MKRVYTILLVAVCIALNISAQSPEKMSYQAVIRNSSNQLVINQAIGMKISILQGTSNGTVIYQETFNPNPQTNANGLVAIEIGRGLPIIGTFGGIDWSAGPYFIKTETDPDGGTNYTITGTSQILSVPYALYAKTAETVTGGISETDPVFTGSQAANITSNDIANLSNLSGANTGDQDLSNFVTTTALTNGLNAKLDKVTGKGLSTEDYTTAEKTKLAGLAIGAEVNVQADWNQATNTADDYIKNKPTIPTAQVQTNWTATTGMGVLLNKPANIDEDKTDDVNLTGNQTITGNKTFTGTTIVAEPINMNDAATKAYVDMIMKKTHSQIAGGTVSDVDGNTYNTVKIVDQIWMAENLKTTKYNDGTDIDISDYTWYNNDEAYKDVYGGLYNEEIDFENICPSGWHVSSRDEWIDLVEFIDEITSIPGNSEKASEGAGGKLKEEGMTHWNSPNTSAINAVGFTALPGGHYQGYMPDLVLEAYYYGIGEYANFWCYGWGDQGFLGYGYMKYNSSLWVSDIFFEWGQYYLSIRCLKN